MSKIINVEYDELRQCRVYRSNPVLQPFHREYGLWIFFAYRSDGSRIRHYQEPDPRYFCFYNISYLIKGKGWYWTPEHGRREYGPGEAVTLMPGVIHDYNGDDDFEEDFICFAGPLADHLARSGIIQPGIVEAGTTRLLVPIIEAATDPSRDSQIRANLALQNLLVQFYFTRQQQTENPHHSALETLIAHLTRHPEKWWTVEEMAAMVKLSVNQFIRIFAAHTGLTPKKYLDELKIKHAAEALRNPHRTVGQVAEYFGYRDQFHFSKRFKKLTGMSPAEYRRQTL